EFFFFFFLGILVVGFFFFFSSRRRHTRFKCDWSSDVCSSDLSPSARCLADFVAPKETRLVDHIGGFAVTSGGGLKELCDHFRAQHDDYNAIMAEALADRLAEAFAEYLHKRVREEWGYGRG